LLAAGASEEGAGAGASDEGAGVASLEGAACSVDGAGAASSLDSDIVQEPKITIETAKAFAAVHEEIVAGKVGEPMPLALPQATTAMKAGLAPGEAKPPTVKVFSDGGEATMESGGLQFIPTRPGMASVRLYTIEQGSGAIAQRKVAMKVEK